MFAHRVLVFTGGRDFVNEKVIDDLISFLDFSTFTKVYVGDCPTGLDELIRYKFQFDDRLEVFKANWKDEGLAAGPIRNRKMLETALNDTNDVILFAFAGGKGTANCVNTAKKLGITVFKVECTR